MNKREEEKLKRQQEKLKKEKEQAEAAAARKRTQRLPVYLRY